MILTGETRRTRRKTCPSATSSTTNLSRTDRGANTGLRGLTPATNRLSYGRAIFCISLVQGFSTGVPRDVARGSARDRD
jgi:hypothetical protein